jgi:hypothetical protein
VQADSFDENLVREKVRTDRSFDHLDFRKVKTGPFVES